MARILEDQHKYDAAAEVYDALAAERPDEAMRFAQRAADLRGKVRRHARPRNSTT